MRSVSIVAALILACGNSKPQASPGMRGAIQIDDHAIKVAASSRRPLVKVETKEAASFYASHCSQPEDNCRCGVSGYSFLVPCGDKPAGTIFETPPVP